MKETTSKKMEFRLQSKSGSRSGIRVRQSFCLRLNSRFRPVNFPIRTWRRPIFRAEGNLLVTCARTSIDDSFQAVGGGSKREGIVGTKREVIWDQKENSAHHRRIRLVYGTPAGLAPSVPSQDKALRKRNLSGGGTSQLSDSATASAFTEAVLFWAELFSTRVQSEKLRSSWPPAVPALTLRPKMKSLNSLIAFRRSLSRKSSPRSTPANSTRAPPPSGYTLVPPNSIASATTGYATRPPSPPSPPAATTKPPGPRPPKSS
jgi:hypothetical protein